MEINSDFDVAASAHAQKMSWTPSPISGVSRRMLDRIGDEVARATSIVRYDPDSQFSAHVHSGGEEFLVLEGVFQDEHGDYPTGTYVRNPVNTKHTPASTPGCQIFVKLWQFGSKEKDILRIDTNTLELVRDERRDGVNYAPLYEDDRERVAIEQWNPNTDITVQAAGGSELLVLEGSFAFNGESYGKHSWLRLPQTSNATATAGHDGTRVWIKTGHLPFVTPPTTT